MNNSSLNNTNALLNTKIPGIDYTGANYNLYRCNVDPGQNIMDKPLFRMLDTCPCTDTNPTGRGFTACPLGVVETPMNTGFIPLTGLKYDPLTGIAVNKQINVYNSGSVGPENNNGSIKSPLEGSLFSNGSFVPPQLDYRPLYRVGISYRN